MKNFLLNLWDLIIYPYRYFKDRQRIKKRLKELREKDPFIYK